MNRFLSRLKRAVPLAGRRRIKRRLQDAFDVPTVERSLESMRGFGFRVTQAIDIGAYQGEWTLLTRKIFPEASVLMLEAQQEQAADLEVVKRSCPEKIDYRIALLGPENRDDVVFNQYDAPTGASMLSYLNPGKIRRTTRRMETLDSILSASSISKPDLIKLDVQGYELEVLKGGENVLRSAQAVLMEVSFFELYANNPLIHDVLNFMVQHDFVTFDICGVLRCPEDGRPAQADVIFVRRSSPLFGRKT